MTILPGHPLPEWAGGEPVEAEASAQPVGADPTQPMEDAADGSQSHTAPDGSMDVVEEVRAGAEPALATALVGAGASAADAAFVPPAFEHPGLTATPAFGSASAPSGAAEWPATASAPTSAAVGAFGAPGVGYPGSPGAGQVTGYPGAGVPRPGSPVGQDAGYGARGSIVAPPGARLVPQPPSPRSAPEADHPAGATGTATMDGPGAPTAASGPDPAAAPDRMAGSGTSPSAEWSSPTRPELSPEHVALLTWWADMIAKGQFPAPPGSPDAAQGEADPGAKGSKRRSARRDSGSGGDPSSGTRRRNVLVGLSLGGIAVAGLAVAFGGQILSAFADEPAPAPVTNLTMPTSVGELVALTSPEVSEQLATLLGFGLRPAGVTVASAYGTPDGPLALAAMATTVPPASDAIGQINEFAARTGAQVVDPVTGGPSTGGPSTGGVTCAEVTAIEAAPTGSICIWTGSGRSGQAYVVGTSPEVALERTAELRAGVTASS